VLFARLFPLRGALVGKIRTTVRSHA
jgi:hypothetical protein